ncbi:MAG: nuclear transport factor 2 family protein [Terriglobales bacterium]|jgi:ketosteroid isomerase-like protein
MKPTFSVIVPVFLVACLLGSVRAQTNDKKDEIPIERCDRLPVVTMKVAGQNRRFLLDTAAVTFLNRNSFASGDSAQVHIYTWSGSAATSAREVFLPQAELGTHKLHDLKLPAIDLSAVGKACGGQIDGILGVDLLDHMGITIDLKRGVAVLAPVAEPGDSGDALAAAERDLESCIVAFNHGEVKAMAECFDPEIVFYTQRGEYRGREEVMRYLSQRFFKDAPRPHYDAMPHDVRIFGDVLWYSYDFWIDSPKEHLAGHGMTMCRKDAGGRWRMLSVDNSLKEAAGAPDLVH